MGVLTCFEDRTLAADPALKAQLQQWSIGGWRYQFSVDADHDMYVFVELCSEAPLELIERGRKLYAEVTGDDTQAPAPQSVEDEDEVFVTIKDVIRDKMKECGFYVKDLLSCAVYRESTESPAWAMCKMSPPQFWKWAGKATEFRICEICLVFFNGVLITKPDSEGWAMETVSFNFDRIKRRTATEFAEECASIDGDDSPLSGDEDY